MVATSSVILIFRLLVALKLATVVVEATVSGAVPVGVVDVKVPAESRPVEGTKVSRVFAVRCPQLPELLVTKVG